MPKQRDRLDVGGRHSARIVEIDERPHGETSCRLVRAWLLPLESSARNILEGLAFAEPEKVLSEIDARLDAPRFTALLNEALRTKEQVAEWPCPDSIVPREAARHPAR